jgi:glycosyltransferase involved in cell wall biosynthesis
MPHPALRLHLAVFPSKCQETYGLVVDEALARGVPVVVSDNGALVERAALGGAVVTPVAALREAVHGVARSRDVLERLRRAIPQDMGSIEDAAERYVAMYRRAMEER